MTKIIQFPRELTVPEKLRNIADMIEAAAEPIDVLVLYSGEVAFCTQDKNHAVERVTFMAQQCINRVVNATLPGGSYTGE